MATGICPSTRDDFMISGLVSTTRVDHASTDVHASLPWTDLLLNEIGHLQLQIKRKAEAG